MHCFARGPIMLLRRSCMSASYVDSDDLLRKKSYNKRDDFNFPILDFPFICSNIPAAPGYKVYISHLIEGCC